MKTAILAGWIGGVMAVQAADVSGWRNDGNGLYPNARASLDWSKSLWKSDLPAPSNACPILVDGKLIFTAEPATLMAADAGSGELLWQSGNEYIDLLEGGKEEAEAAKKKMEEVKLLLEPLEKELYRAQRLARRNKDDKEANRKLREARAKVKAVKASLGEAAEFSPPPAHKTNGYSSYTPVSDGKRVWACFGNGVVVSYDLKGKRLWHKRLSAPDHNWGGACSPVLAGGVLVVRFSDYVGLDPATGEELWRTPSEGVTFNAPAQFERGGQHFLITSRGELIEAGDGKKLKSSGFTVKAKPWCFLNTPSVIGNHVYFAHGSEGEQGDAYCLEIPANAADVQSQGLKQVWHQQVSKNRYYSSPLVHDGIVYLISREYVLQALDAASGEVFYEQKIKGLTGTAYPSLTLVGDTIFVGAEDGRAAFVKPGESYQEMARTETDPYRSTPIFVDDRTYLRTQETLRAISVK